ncbi:MAG: hypothetical protein P0111_03990 [Nitrospira sp.]|nr:hypothetical protein [Nitrospira sp.]
MEVDDAERYARLRESIPAQDARSKAGRDRLRTEVNNRLDEVNRQMALLRKDPMSDCGRS